MKRLMIFNFACLLALFIQAQTTKTITLSFSANDYGLEVNELGENFITSSRQVFYEERDSLPCLPFVVASVAVPIEQAYATHDWSEQQTVFANGIVLANSPQIIATNMVDTIGLTLASYPSGIYPSNKVTLAGQTTMGVYRILSFKVTPFEYDTSSGQLKLSSQITLNINLVANNNVSMPENQAKVNYPALAQMVINGGEVQPPTEANLENTSNSTESQERIDYLIITSANLAPAFAPLVEWKITKGVRTKVITMDSIQNHYSDSTIQLKIKRCLYEHYLNNGLKFALLGGDNTIVPAKTCYAKVVSRNTTATTPDMPTDVFYSCFDGPFDWNSNENMYGVMDENINPFPSIFVTRIPVRTAVQTAAFVNKILSYEQTPTLHGWKNEILMGGCEMHYYADSRTSDANYFGNKIYEEVFEGNWNGTRKRIYDTCTDFSDEDYCFFSRDILQTLLSSGYAFVDIMTHGDNVSWSMEGGNTNYGINDAATLTNTQPCIIVTTACNTNAFDLSEPCLSEAFIRNPDNAVVAYVGSSREGFEIINMHRSWGPSSLFDKLFYKNMLAGNKKKHFGEVVAHSKMDYGHFDVYYTYDYAIYLPKYRWIFLATNPIGDPEMPIYTDTPVAFNNVRISPTSTGIEVDAGTPGSTICVMSINDNGETYYEVRDSVQTATFENLDCAVSICITKHNHIPYLAQVDVTAIQDEIIDATRTNQIVTGDVIRIGSHVTSTKSYGPVFFRFRGYNYTVVQGKNGILIDKGTTIDRGSSFFYNSNQ